MILKAIDRVVGEKFMGFKPIYDDKVLISFETEFGELFFSNDDSCEWNPTTDINDAFLVVSKLKEKYVVSLEMYKDSTACTLSHEINDGGENFFSSLEKEAETTPIAICLAALASVGIDAPLFFNT